MIRRAIEADAAAIAALHVRAWQWAFRGLLPDAYLDGLTEQVARREAMWRRQLQEGRPDCPVWVAERGDGGGQIVGFCNTAPAASSTDSASEGTPAAAELYTIYLDPDAVGTGVGAALMRHGLMDLQARGFHEAVLWVQDTNTRARRFYEKGGWRVDGAEKTETVWDAPVRQVRYRIALAARHQQ